MSEFIDQRLPGSGLHPSHFAALRTEILRTGDELSPEQLLNLTNALCSLISPGRSGQPILRHDAWVKDEPPAFAQGRLETSWSARDLRISRASIRSETTPQSTTVATATPTRVQRKAAPAIRLWRSSSEPIRQPAYFSMSSSEISSFE